METITILANFLMQGQCRSTSGRLFPKGLKKPNAESLFFAEVQPVLAVFNGKFRK